MTIKLTTIIGYDAPRSEMPAVDQNDGMDRYAWIRQHMKDTHRRGHWNMESARKIADRLGIVDGLEIKHHTR